MAEENLRTQLYDSFKNRAVIYYLIFDELRTELGAARAEELLSRAIYRRGQQKGREQYARYAPDDLAGLKAAFLHGVADDGRMFRPEVLRSDAQTLDIKFHACPLRDAWLAAGLGPEDVAALCRIASRVRLRHLRGRRLPLLGRYLAARRRRLLLLAHSAGHGSGGTSLSLRRRAWCVARRRGSMAILPRPSPEAQSVPPNGLATRHSTINRSLVLLPNSAPAIRLKSECLKSASAVASASRDWASISRTP